VVFFERVRERYLAIAAAEPQRVRILEATLPPAALLDAAMDAVQPWFEWHP
jgi:dTMP kinase